MEQFAEYRFLHTKDGITSFAKVTLRPRGNTDGPAHAEVEPVSGCVADVPPGLADQWVLAATAGCRDAIRDASLHPGSGLLIVAIHGTVVDTTNDAVQCAAYLATLRLLAPDVTPPSISADRPWRIVR